MRGSGKLRKLCSKHNNPSANSTYGARRGPIIILYVTNTRGGGRSVDGATRSREDAVGGVAESSAARCPGCEILQTFVGPDGTSAASVEGHARDLYAQFESFPQFLAGVPDGRGAVLTTEICLADCLAVNNAAPYQHPRSPDLNALDLYLWRHLKARVYATPADDMGCPYRPLEIIRLRNNQGLFSEIHQRIRVSMQRRDDACVPADGGHFEHFL
ncbi:hypothetical protein PR048_028102 [Dryococelus australis]|uniref:Uncharacterized protein n=1 Tax=Dryococelus australis TaxID=614101 RepID=A0ABQ9GIC2_9NEOP|nr:hypothetical protein PR048_028102 [Dryococelus australis]